MSYDESSTKYHLTPSGWKTGDAPLDRVETWIRSSRQASGWSRDAISWRCIWASPDVLRAARDALRRIHVEFMGRGRDITIGEPL